MGKSTGGPDWTDIEMMLRAIDAATHGKTGVLLSPRGIGGTGGLSIDVVSSLARLPGSSEPGDLVTSSHWPCAEGCSLETHIFGGLYKHDRTLMQADIVGETN